MCHRPYRLLFGRVKADLGMQTKIISICNKYARLFIKRRFLPLLSGIRIMFLIVIGVRYILLLIYTIVSAHVHADNMPIVLNSRIGINVLL